MLGERAAVFDETSNLLGAGGCCLPAWISSTARAGWDSLSDVRPLDDGELGLLKPAQISTDTPKGVAAYWVPGSGPLDIDWEGANSNRGCRSTMQ